MPARALVLATCLAGVCVFAWTSVLVYRAQADPEGVQARHEAAWILGPTGGSLETAAVVHLQGGLARLNDSSRTPADRLGGYREELLTAETLLIRSLRARPTQPRTLARLAATRWELAPPTDAPGILALLRIVELASRMAPTAPRVQTRLGRLLLEMGRDEEALAYLARAAELDPRLSGSLVELMRDHLYDAMTIHDSLPASPWLLVALRRPFGEESRMENYVQIVERALREPLQATPMLLASFGSACLGIDAERRLRESMEHIGRLEDAEADAERLRQLSRAWSALGDPDRALESAREACQRDPSAPRLAEHLGDTALSSGEADLALRAFREALGLVARGSGSPSVRARLYRKTGQVQERRGLPDRAFDAYKMALELDADERYARRRIAEMERAAGIR